MTSDTTKLTQRLVDTLKPATTPLTDAEIDRIASGELGVGPTVGDRLIAQAREANKLRAEVTHLRGGIESALMDLEPALDHAASPDSRLIGPAGELWASAMNARNVLRARLAKP